MADAPALDLSWRSGSDAAPLAELLYAALDDFEPIAIHEQDTADGWRVFFRTIDSRDEAASALRELFGERLEAIHAVDVSDEDWARRSQSKLSSIRVGRFVVAPPWDLPTSGPGRPEGLRYAIGSGLLIVIDPSTGFGTGHHETTRLCLRLLQEVEPSIRGQRVIDAGTGSGVLAIAAAKLAAASVVAFDDDPDALRNARENVDRNGVSDTVALRQMDLAAPALDLAPAVLVLANLTSGVLLNYADRLRGLVQSDGRMIVSGFHPADLEEILETFDGEEAHSLVEGDWAAAIVSGLRAQT